MGIELELFILLAVAIVGQSVFAVFEVETPPWRKVLKWSIVVAITLGLYGAVGHWALILPVAAGLAGVVGHSLWCRKHGIDPLRALPRKRYYELRGWSWPE